MRSLNKRGLSPVVATILLISIALLLAAIIFLWARGLLAERNQKFDEPVENACKDVSFEAEAFEESGKIVLGIVNRGNVPLHSLEVQVISEGAIRNLEVHSLSEGRYGTIRSGESVTDIELNDVSVGDDLNIIPIILGQKGNVKTPFPCEGETGQRVRVN